jgi:hypothetical protein
MKQIKTIYDGAQKEFDKRVNEALADGWTLTRRDFDDRGYLAELEKDDEPPTPCRACKYETTPGYMYPCCKCALNTYWVPKETTTCQK